MSNQTVLIAAELAAKEINEAFANFTCPETEPNVAAIILRHFPSTPTQSQQPPLSPGSGKAMREAEFDYVRAYLASEAQVKDLIEICEQKQRHIENLERGNRHLKATPFLAQPATPPLPSREDSFTLAEYQQACRNIASLEERLDVANQKVEALIRASGHETLGNALARLPSIGDGKDGERIHKVMQTKFGKDGDCFNACLATLLNVPLESLDYFRGEDTWYADLQAWLAPRGLAYVEVDDNKTPTPFYRFPLPVLAIASGPSPRGVEGGHACVVEMTGWNRKIVHDPHPDNTGLEQIKSIGLLVRRSAQSPQAGREEK